MGKFDNYLYYKGEEKSPYLKQGEFGKDVWWRIESYAAERGDKKEKGKLSKTMTLYIQERVWQNDSGWDTSRETAMQRAHELYIKGLWDIGYICDNEYTIEQVEHTNNTF